MSAMGQHEFFELQELARAEAVCIEKLGVYARMCQSNEVRQLCQDLQRDAINNYNALQQLMQQAGVQSPAARPTVEAAQPWPTGVPRTGIPDYGQYRFQG